MLELRKFEKTDFDRLISWVPDERFLIQWAGPLFTWPLDEAQLDKYLRETEGEKPKRYVFKAIRMADNEVVGHVEFDYINYEESTGTLSRVLIGEPKNRRKGYGTEMIKLAIDFAFDKICLSRINLAVFDFNEPAISCYEKTGFREYDFKKEPDRKKEPRIKFRNEYWKCIMMKLRKEDYC